MWRRNPPWYVFRQVNPFISGKPHTLGCLHRENNFSHGKGQSICIPLANNLEKGYNMKIRMHYLFGKKQKVACGKKNVLVTTNYREITCGLCKRTVAHKATRNDT